MTTIGVIVDSSANISTIARLHDQISNTLSTNLGKWIFEYKLFRENPASSPSGAANKRPSSVMGSSFLYTLTFSHELGALFCINNGTGTVLEGDFEAMLSTKLQSLWTLRQVIQGEGYSYELDGGNFVLRLANMFLQGSYKGLLVQVEYNSSESETIEEDSTKIEKINAFLTQYGLKFTGNQLATGRIEAAKQYIDALTR